MAEHTLDVLRPGMQVLQLVSKLLLGQRGDLILGKRVNGAAFLVEHQVVLQRQFTDAIQWVLSFEKFAGHSDRTEIRILEKLEIRLTRQVLKQVVQRVVVEPETVARVERWVSWFAGRRELRRCGSWVNFRGRCRRRRRIWGLWQSLQPCIRSRDGRCAGCRRRRIGLFWQTLRPCYRSGDG